MASVRQRFESKYRVDGNGCWIWTACKSEAGYGLMSFGSHPNRRWRSAHRVSFELSNGAFPEHLKICHKCDVPSCVNPDHLFLGTQGENIEDMVRKGRCIRAKGEAASNSKLTEDQVRLILNDKRTSHWARVFGIALSTVKRIRNGKTWKHLHEGEPPSLHSS